VSTNIFRRMPSSGMLLHVTHGVTSQKATFFIVTTMKTSNLTNTFGFKKEVTGIWTKLYNNQFHNLYLSPNILG
jgi:hypothetical protein